jgi:hypothetical protein
MTFLAALLNLLGFFAFLFWLFTMRSRLLAHVHWASGFTSLACFVLGAMAAWGAAKAQDHHPLHRDFYIHWKQPGSSLSCCNARIEVDGHETGDCEPTEAKLIAGRWYARLPHQGPFIEVPEAKIIREHNPTHDGTDAHLCWTEASGVMCFVPPFGGG